MLRLAAGTAHFAESARPSKAMKRTLAALLEALLAPTWPRPASRYGLLLAALLLFACSRGSRRTMRVDYSHSGNATEEHFALERVVLEPLEWPGNPARAVDDTNLGKYFFEVIDIASHRVLYSRGFAS